MSSDSRLRILRDLAGFAWARRSFRTGLLIIGFWMAIAILAPVISPYPPTQPGPGHVLLAPSLSHLLGTDENGMDILSRILWAPRIDLGIAVTATACATALGIPIGALAGFFGGRRGWLGRLADWTMRLVDVSLAFPVFVFALALVAVLGASIVNIVLALTFVNTPVFIWLTRSQVLSVRERPFVEGARCVGNSDLRIVFKHVLPNAIAAPLTQVSIVLGFAILLTASLSFVGAGVPIPTPEWGLMVSQGASNLISGQWWPAAFPGLALASAVVGFSLVGDGLRLYLDPKLRVAGGPTVPVVVPAV
jgi:peptide/nickel transport system permease protein